MGDRKKRKKVKPDTRPYRKGVGIVLFNREGKVFAGERLDTPGAWQLPQGGIDKGEKPRQAAFRELAEEIGTDKADILSKSRDWLPYDLPEEVSRKVWRGKYRGQKQRWFAMRFTGCDSDIDLAASGHPEFGAWRWVTLEDLPGMIVSFKRPLYEKLVEEFHRVALEIAGS